jgi:sigma-E factor negative regulatory protein RseB
MKMLKLTKGLSLAGIIIIPLLMHSPVALADEAAIELINRMNRALRELDYKGSLAYLRGDSLSTLQIEHKVINGVESERVVRLNESGGEVSREFTGFSLSSIPQIVPEMNRVYSFDMGRTNRIANIPCRIITARPKDRNRYLQKFCIDDVTGMLLDYMLVGKSHKPVEQLMFTTLEIGVGEIADEQVTSNDEGAMGAASATKAVLSKKLAQTSLSEAKSTHVGAVTVDIQPQVQPLPQGQVFEATNNIDLDDGWVMETLPAGFQIKSAPAIHDAQSAESITKHYIVSDGLSSLSVFVSPLTAGVSNAAVKINSGALNVVSQEKNGHLVTVVGEVPETTLKNIVKSLQKK